MRVGYVSQAAPGAAVNEDFVLAGEDFVVVLDGATRSAPETGCAHDVAWVTRRLGVALGRLLVEEPGLTLTRTLALAIERVRRLHGAGCDLDHPDSPSATVALLRRRGEWLEHLVLADSPVLIELTDGRLEAVLDDRVDQLPAYDLATVARLRNAPGGFWVAGARVAAAEQALTGAHPVSSVTRFAVLTDGVSRLVERYGWSWRQLLDLLDEQGPDSAVRAVRAAELADPPGRFRGKRHDDATVAFGRLGPVG
ncbi:protein phosphatase 2C domain-containing protein [Kitasatospora sp. NBC_01287]|uniref:protein phosphatase 2C domain-containing protein n=1 Tax=Kitasatospora sp. NBC_01287 TaxID=2903573 RepID=UPI00225B4DB0|nr:protein phosphatase 2C domain-containing protein [Kitasatospora sp. NBC_01287]MCX4747681.1 protein phosphatase 2C domain-containing protein [Kitasatospora sp. NBC_01287]